MAGQYDIEKLPEVDQRMIKRGLCPWCVASLYDDGEKDVCSECGDSFVGKLVIED